MRLAPSFLLSLLMLLSIFWGQALAMAAPEVPVYETLLDVHAIVALDEDALAELEEEDETEFAELTAHSGNSRQLLTLPCAEDRTEMFWPPEPVVVPVLPIWAPPSSRAWARLSPSPVQLLRPPKPFSLG
ncbi:MAG: hypothetical protein LBI66_04280 [Burkholderiaceae bacterium]|jgi:hypothetical protein|nr:hypothetical protein [Burkholderiaceae bacterium]